MDDPVSNPQPQAMRPAFALLLLAAGIALRLRLAWQTFLNPDEALHFFLSHQPSLALAYQASLVTAHPPLMVLLLHCWSWLGDSEFVLRLPFVIAGTLFCWTMFCWITRIAGSNVGLITLALLLFSPPLISLSAEIRQYSLLLLFCAACLYFLDRAFEEQSATWMALSISSLYFALLTHYSALIFAAAAGFYGLLRLRRGKPPWRVAVVWIAGQAGALVICGFLFFTQISRLRQSGLPSEIAATWLSSSIFHPGEDHFIAFAVSRTVRLFRYMFSHGTVGVLALALFLLAIMLLLQSADSDDRKPASRELALLFGLPFLIALGAAVAGIYPYGGTRHDVVLAMFAMPAIAIGLGRLEIPALKLRWAWAKPLLLAGALLVCNLFPSPSGPYIPPRNQNRKSMAEAMAFLKSTPADSVFFAGFGGTLVLNYYLCGKRNTIPLQPPAELLHSGCAGYRLVTLPRAKPGFEGNIFSQNLEEPWQTAPTEDSRWLFQTGWIGNKGQDRISELHRLGCQDPHNFSPNILICPLQPTRP